MKILIGYTIEQSVAANMQSASYDTKPHILAHGTDEEVNQIIINIKKEISNIPYYEKESESLYDLIESKGGLWGGAKGIKKDISNKKDIDEKLRDAYEFKRYKNVMIVEGSLVSFE